MRSIKILTIILTLLVGLGLSGCGLSLAEDVTPPPNYRPPTPAEEQPVELKTVFPIVPPDPAQGEAIYVEKCLPCHGETGMGDGPQAANLPNPAAPLGDPALARASRPVDWYQVVTVGNLERFMPGFTQSLNDRQRWDVVAYTTTLSTTKAELAQGKVIYEQNCASCHGLTGAGDGEKAAGLQSRPASWTDQSTLAALSADSMVALVLNGKGEMPAYRDQLDEDQAYAAAAYIRTLGYASAGQPVEAAQATPAAAADETPAAGAQTPAAPSQITITGKVTNGTPGGKVPQGLKATLLAYQDMNPSFELETDVAGDGSFTFEDVDFNSSYVYFVRVEANNLFFNSDILHGRDLQGDIGEMPVVIYETTTDAAVLQTDRLHVFFDFSQPGKVQVVSLYIISNPSGMVVMAPGEGQPAIEFELPEGAENLQFQDGVIGERYLQTEKGFGDTQPVMPGQGGVNQVLFAFDLPYINELDLSLKMPMSVQAAAVMLPAAGVELKSSQLVDSGPQQVQGMSFQMYQTSAAVAPGESIQMTLKGSPGAGSTGEVGTNRELFIGLGVFGLVLAGAGTWLYWRRTRAADEDDDEDVEELEEDAEDQGSSESILDAIVALDDQHAAGNLPDPAYQQRRAELKARLAEALDKEKGA